MTFLFEVLMSETTWMVIRCPHCGYCSGHRQGKGRCPLCGMSFPRDVEVVVTVSHADALQREVALANTPESLRKELRKHMERDLKKTNTANETSPTAIFQALREAANAEGELTSTAVMGVLQRLGTEQSVDEVMTRAETEGLVLRLARGCWMLLE